MRAKRATLAVVLVSCFSAAATAQDQEEHPNGFFLTSPLTLSSGWDQNFVNGTQDLIDTEADVLGPTFAWMKNTHTTDFLINYQPEVQIFAHNPRLNAWDSQSQMRLLHHFNGRWTLDVGNYFVSTTDPTRFFVNSLLLLPLGRFNQNSFYGSVIYRLNYRTKLTFRVDNSFTDSNGVVGYYAGRLNETATAGTVTIDHKFGHKHDVTGNYSFLHVDPLNSVVTGGATNVNLFSGAYIYTINPGLDLHFSGGAVEGGGQNAAIGAAAIEKRLKQVWFAGGYQRYVSFFGGLAPLSVAAPSTTGFAQGLAPSNLYEVGSLRAWGPLSKRVAIEAGGEWGRIGVNELGQEIRGAIAHAQIDYKLNDRVSWFARAEYYDQNVADFIPFPNARRRYAAGVEIALARPPEGDVKHPRRSLPPDEATDAPVPDQDPGLPEER